MYRRVETAITSYRSNLGTIDQTRWGPNFNTVTFGLMACLFIKSTTEAYIPALTCFLSEFKAFEVPSWCENLYKECNSHYSLPGKLGRSHMGQGIFHVSSSVYHSFVIKKIQRVYAEICLEGISDNPSYKYITLHQTSMVTSDDVATMDYITLADRSEYILENQTGNSEIIEEGYTKIKELADSLMIRINIAYKVFDRMVVYFGIKTNDYKNIFSDHSIEFNSEFISTEGIGSNEIKFVCSLIDPHTTGDFLADYKNCIDLYYTSLQAGCHRSGAFSIVRLKYLIFCRLWLLRPDIVGLPTRGSIVEGMNPTYKLDKELYDSRGFSTPSHLRFKTRAMLNDLKNAPLSDLGKTLLTQRLSQISGTRAKSSFRSCLTHYTGRRAIFTLSNYYQEIGACGETFESFVYNQNINGDHYQLALNEEVESPFLSIIVQKETKPTMFQRITIRNTSLMTTTTWEMILGLSDPVESISLRSTDEEIHMHLMRHEHSGYFISDDFELRQMTLSKKIETIEEIRSELSLYSSSCSYYIYSKSQSSKKYLRNEILAPITKSFLRTSLTTQISSSSIGFIHSYNQNKDFIGLLEISNSTCVCKIPRGLLSVSHRSKTNLTILEPGLDDILTYCDKRLIEEDKKYHNYSKIRTYINVIPSESLDIDKNYDEEEPDLEYNEENIDLLMANFDDDFNFDLDSLKSETNSQTSSNRDILDMMLGGTKAQRYVSYEVNVESSIYTEGYFRKRLVLNYILNKLLMERGFIVQNAISGYIVNELCNQRVYFTDPDLPKKINGYVKKICGRLPDKTFEYHESWINLAKDLIDGRSIVNGDDLKHKIPLIVPNEKILITTRPLGKIVDKKSMYLSIDSINTH